MSHPKKPDPAIYGTLLLESAGHKNDGSPEKKRLALAIFKSFSLEDQKTLKLHFDGVRSSEALSAKSIYIAEIWFRLSLKKWTFEEIDLMVLVLRRLKPEQRKICLKHWLKGQNSPLIPNIIAFGRSARSFAEKSSSVRKKVKGQLTLSFYPDYLPDWARRSYESWNGPKKYITVGDTPINLLALAKSLIRLLSTSEDLSRDDKFPMTSLRSLCRRAGHHEDDGHGLLDRIVEVMAQSFSINVLIREGKRRTDKDDNRKSWYSLSPLGQYLLDEIRRTEGEDI